MSAPLFEPLAGHNLWATRVLVDDARRLTEDQFHRRFEIGPGSIHDTLRHIIGAMRRWADRIGGRAVRPSIEDEDPRYAARELRVLLDGAGNDLNGVAAEIDARQGWHETLEFVMPDGSKTYRFTRVAAMSHVLTHGMHHRAQVLNMRRRLGLPALGLDLDVVEWECVKTGQIEDAIARLAM